MAGKEKVGVCALCGREEPLMQSHLIPKLVYRRIKKSGRFRSLDDINKIFQDGEKRPMLCHGCEELFSSYEQNFAKTYLDTYLNEGKVRSHRDGLIENYIITVAWRILWDDLFRLNSFSGKWQRSLFEAFEKEMKSYLNSLGSHNGTYTGHCFINRVYRLTDLIRVPEYSAEFESVLFGYANFFGSSYTFSVIVQYAGLVFVTDYVPQNNKFIVIGKKKWNFFKSIYRKGEIRKELYEYLKLMVEQHRRVITPEVQNMIANHYK